MNIKVFQRFDFFLMISVLVLTILGILAIYSAGFNSDGVNLSNEYMKQIIWVSFGFCLMILFALVDYRAFEKYAVKLFLFLIFLLIITRLFGKKVNDSYSWIGIGSLGIQPSEGCKILFIIFLSHFFNSSKNFSGRTRFILSILIFLVPFGLIMVQPDLGTASVYFAIYFFMLLFTGIPLRYIMLLLLGSVLTVYLLVLPEWYDQLAKRQISLMPLLINIKLRGIVFLACVSISLVGVIGKFVYKDNKYFYWISYAFGILSASLVFSYVGGKVMKPYQLERLIIFLDPENDPLGGGWQILKSLTTIGSGGITGKGFRNGMLIHAGYLPESSTDFVFGTYSEEFGFVGAVVVFALYFIIFAKNLLIIKNCIIPFGTYIAAGIFGMFLWHFVENIGMVISRMPITGIPLMFMSYGGSSLLTAMVAIGILMNIRFRKYDF